MLDDGRIVRQHLDHICEQVYEPVTETDSHIDSGSDASLDLPSVESCEILTDLFNADNSSEPSTTEVCIILTEYGVLLYITKMTHGLL